MRNPASGTDMIMLQAILKREIHPFVKTGEIREGSFVNVTKYNLARRKRLRGEGEVVYVEGKFSYPGKGLIEVVIWRSQTSMQSDTIRGLRIAQRTKALSR